jgi:hypothetical protein
MASFKYFKVSVQLGSYDESGIKSMETEVPNKAVQTSVRYFSTSAGRRREYPANESTNSLALRSEHSGLAILKSLHHKQFCRRRWLRHFVFSAIQEQVR